MKSRTGFVSNSSSCSFIIESQAKVHLPAMHGQHINRIVQAVEGINFGIVSNTYTSGYFQDKDENEEKHVSVATVVGYENNETPLTVVTISLKKEVSKKDDIDLIEETRRIYTAIVNCLFDDDEGYLNLKNKEGVLYYSQTAQSSGDGGWDGGDPGGDYNWSRDLLREQTKAGTITLKGRGIRIDIKSPFKES